MPLRPRLAFWMSLFWVIGFGIFLASGIPKPAWVTVQAALAIVLAIAERTDEVLG